MGEVWTSSATAVRCENSARWISLAIRAGPKEKPHRRKSFSGGEQQRRKKRQHATKRQRSSRSNGPSGVERKMLKKRQMLLLQWGGNQSLFGSPEPLGSWLRRPQRILSCSPPSLQPQF